MKQSVSSRINSWTHSRLSVPDLGFKYSALAALLACVIGLLCAPGAHAQGTRKDDIVFGPQGRPVAGASVATCTQPANTTTAPCSPLASIFSDPGLTQSLVNPTKTDGLGNYHFYAAPGKYTVQVFGPGLTATVIPDVTIPNDPMNPTVSTITSSGGVSAFTLTLGGNLTVGGNASVTGSITAGTLNVSNFNPTQLSVTGPRPRVDVTAAPYGAKGDGVTDDTAAIQAAINAACATPTGGGGVVVFPPTVETNGSPVSYIIKHSTVDDNPVFTFPAGCKEITFQGSGSYNQSAGYQFSRPPLTSVFEQPCTAGATGPVIAQPSSFSLTIRDLAINGCNQALRLYNTANFVAEHFTFGCANTGQAAGGLLDNTPVLISDIFWARFSWGSFNPPDASHYAMVMAPVSTGGEIAVGLLKIEDVISAGSYLFDQRAAPNVSEGSMIFYNDQIEGPNLPFLTVTTSSSTPGTLFNLDFRNDAAFDCSNAPFMLVQNGMSVQSVRMENVQSCSGGTLPNGAALELTGAGFANDVKVDTASPSRLVVDGSGNPISSTIPNIVGYDFFANTADTGRRRTDSTATFNVTPNGYPIRMTAAGANKTAQLGLDPVDGVRFGDGTNNGYSAALTQTTLGALDVQVATQMPPTNVSVSAAGGGSCAAGTYYYKVYANNAGFTQFSYPSLEKSVTLTLNQEAQLTWTAALGSSVGGYTIYRSAGTANFFSTQPFYQVGGGATSGFTDTCGAPTGNGAPPLVGENFASTFRVTPSSPHIDVTAFGAKCDGVTDDAANIQKAINAAAANGSTIFFPPGSCYIHSALSTTGKNLILRGSGGGWSGTNASEIISDQAIVLLTFGTGGSTTQAGPKVENLGFRDSSAGHNTVLGAVNLVREDFWFLDNINCADITVGYCVQLDGTGDFTQIGTILNPKARNVKFPLKTVTNASAVSMFGGSFVCNSIAGSIGIDIETSDTFLVDGTDINACTTDAVKIFQSNANHIHARMENTGPTGVGVLVDGSGANGSNGNDISFNSMVGFTTGISITANATKTRVDEPYFSGNTTNLSDSGVQSLIVTPGDQITLGAPPAVATTGMGFFTHTNVPGQGSAAIPGLLLTNGFGAIAMQDKTTAGGFWFNGDQAGRGCLGAGLYGTCSFFGELASNTSAAGIRFGNSAGQIDFFADTGLTAGNSYSPNIRATISTSGIALGQQGAHLNTSTANNDLDGTISISSSTSGSHSFATAFASAPVCTVTPTSDPTAVGVWWATATTSAVTANVKVSGTITFNYHCIGNPN